VQPHLGRLLDDRPRELLGLVVLGSHRADLLLGEGMDPVADLTLLVGQLERNHPCSRSLSRWSFRCSTHWYRRVPIPHATLRRVASSCQSVYEEGAGG